MTQGDFEISLNAGLYENRFRVVFKPFEALDLEHYLNQFVQVYYHQNEIIIDNPVQKNIKSLKIYNVLGQLVYENIKKESLYDVETRIPFNFAQATYVIKLESDEGIGTFKIINY